MAVSQNYMTKLSRAVRRKADVDIDAELMDIIDECRLDHKRAGTTKEYDETDSLILGAVRCYVRWKFGLNSEDAERNRQGYEQLKDDLRHSSYYKQEE